MWQIAISILVAGLSFTAGVDDDDIARLVEDLASPEFALREKAQRRLLEIGAPASTALEKAAQSADVEQRMRARHILQDLRRQDWWRASRVRLEREQAPVLDLFRAVAEQTGNPINWNRSVRSIENKLSVKWTDVPYWQAIDELSRGGQIVVQPYGDVMELGVVLTQGAPDACPTAYNGPLRMRLTHINRSIEQRLSLADRSLDQQDTLGFSGVMHWEQRLALCRYTSRPRIVEAITDANESILRNAQTPMPLLQVTRGQRQLMFQMRLEPPRKPARSLLRLKLQVEVVAAGDFENLSIEPLQPKQSHQQSGYVLEHVETKQLRDRWETSLRIVRSKPYDRGNTPFAVDEYVELRGADGKPLPFQQHRVVGDQNGVLHVLHVLERAGEPKSAHVHVAMGQSRRTVDFEFKDVPLPVAAP